MNEYLRGLPKIIEEAGEVLRIAGKLGAFPHPGTHPSGENLYLELQKELTDLQAAIDYFFEENRMSTDSSRYREKLAKFDAWVLTGVYGEAPTTKG